MLLFDILYTFLLFVGTYVSQCYLKYSVQRPNTADLQNLIDLLASADGFWWSSFFTFFSTMTTTLSQCITLVLQYSWLDTTLRHALNFFDILFYAQWLWKDLVLFFEPAVWILILCLALIVPVLIIIAYTTLLERKLMGSIQRRQGPNVVGVKGLLQPLADGLKLLIKEFFQLFWMTTT